MVSLCSDMDAQSTSIDSTNSINNLIQHSNQTSTKTELA